MSFVRIIFIFIIFYTALFAEQKKAYVMYFNNVGFKSKLLKPRTYVHYPNSSTKDIGSDEISLFPKDINEHMARHFAGFLNKDHFEQIIPLEDYVLVFDGEQITMIETNKKIKAFSNKDSNYKAFKDRALKHLTTYGKEYKHIAYVLNSGNKQYLDRDSEAVKNLFSHNDNPDIYMFLMFIPQVRGRLDIYNMKTKEEKKYKLKSNMDVSIRLSIYKYSSSNDRFEYLDEIFTPIKNNLEELGISSEPLKELNALNMKIEIMKGFNKSMNQSIKHLKRDVLKIDGFNIYGYSDIDNSYPTSDSDTANGSFDSVISDEQKEKVQKVMNKLDNIKTIDSNADSQEILEEDNLEQHIFEDNEFTQSKNPNDKSINITSSALDKVSFYYSNSIINMTYLTKDIAYMSNYLGFGYRYNLHKLFNKDFFKNTYLGIKGGFEILNQADSSNLLPNLDSEFRLIGMFDIGFGNDEYSLGTYNPSYDAYLTLEKEVVSFMDIGLHMGANLHFNIMNISYFTKSGNQTLNMASPNVFVEPTIRISYKALEKVNIGLSMSYIAIKDVVPLYPSDTIEWKILDGLTRNNSFDIHADISYRW